MCCFIRHQFALEFEVSRIFSQYSPLYSILSISMASREVVTGFEKIENEFNLIYLLFHQQDIYEHIIFVSYTFTANERNQCKASHDFFAINSHGCSQTFDEIESFSAHPRAVHKH